VRVIGNDDLKSTNVKTLPYPGFPTDMQPQMAVVLALVNGSSMVTESIFENRFKYVDELNRMGSNIKVEGNTAYIEGVDHLTGAQLAAPDLRAGAALVLAALAADGISEIEDIEYVQRGYEDFDGKLRSLGATIERVNTERDAQKAKLKIG
jgi:UDP-N-acetylglucosamine 1-carboxyvinyltransferase